MVQTRSSTTIHLYCTTCTCRCNAVRLAEPASFGRGSWGVMEIAGSPLPHPLDFVSCNLGNCKRMIGLEASLKRALLPSSNCFDRGGFNSWCLGLRICIMQTLCLIQICIVKDLHLEKCLHGCLESCMRQILGHVYLAIHRAIEGLQHKPTLLLWECRQRCTPAA